MCKIDHVNKGGRNSEMAFYQRTWEYTVSQEHGYGILFEIVDRAKYRKCFYEDGTLASGDGKDGMSSRIDQLRRYASNRDRWSFAYSGISEEEYRKQLSTSSCEISVGKEDELCFDLKVGKDKCCVQVVRSASYGYDVNCSCKGNRSCPHKMIAADFQEQRLDALQHAYLMSSQPVDKSLFVERRLQQAVLDLENGDPNMPTVEAHQDVVGMLRAVNDEGYYRAFQSFLLDLSPGYDYHSRFMEEDVRYLLLALFEDPGYRKTVVEPKLYDEAEKYEERQHKSNRISLKRTLKDYERARKELREKDDYSENEDKEFLLKYRGDWMGLLRYYAEGKEQLEDDDTPFLDRIAGHEGLNPAHLSAVAQKMDRWYYTEETGDLLQRLTAGLTQKDRVEIYSQLRNIPMPAQEIRTLDREAQLKMIYNMPVTEENFRYIMDDLLRDGEAPVRGRYLLHAVQETRFSRNTPLKKEIVKCAAGMPDNRLLLNFVVGRLDVKQKYEANPGDPERELTTYFDCEYKITREPSRLYAEFYVKDPVSGAILEVAIEEKGNLKHRHSMNSIYSPELIRKVCLAGKEEEYDKAFEESQDALASALFEQSNKKFAREYRQLCESLTDEKILFTESGKVGVEWLIYREEDSNALAFRVGHNRMYIVKDAAEFVRAFRNGATVEYGRDLVLTHDPDNLNEADAAVIKLLLTAKFGKGRKTDPKNKRYISVSNALLGNILEILAGRTVQFNDRACLLRMEPKTVRLRISDKYVLSTDVSRGKQEFLNLIGRGYLLTREGEDASFLDRVEGTPDEMNLIELIDRNPSVSIHPILKDFRKNVYSRFFERFDVDKAVQRDFTLSQLRLNTYFDLEKGVITARTDILRDEKKIRPEDLTERMDRMKLELLEGYLQGLGFSEGALSEESRVLAFFKMDFTRLKTLTNVYLSENLKNKELKSIGRPVIRVSYENNLCRVFLEKSDFTEEELEQIIAGLRKKRKYILLGENRIIDLDSDAARDFGETVKDFGMDPKDLYEKKTISMINAIKAFSHERSCRVDKYLRDMIDEIRSFKEAEIEPPRLNAELRDYQTEGFKWLSILTRYNMGGILADDMGLGKTIQMIALIKKDRTRKPTLVVCPKSLVFNWISEFARFDGSTRVMAVYGPDSRRSELISAIDYKEKAVYITSYESLRNDIGKYTGEFNYVILDEAQYIKNVNARKTRSVKELKAAHRFALTGTPIENSVVDLWSIFDFIMPGYFEELSRFRDTEPAAIARKSGPFILRRVKEDVLEDLPPKYERILSADMTTGQRKLYDAMRQEARRALDEGGKAFDMLPYLTRLRQVCVDPGMFVEDYRDGSGKLDMLASLIPEYLADGHRILIFSQFVRALESVNQMLEKLGVPTYFLSGATAAKDRVEMMDSFNNGSGTDVFLISLKAGGTGLNLTGADTVIHLDPWWNVAAENQASDRTHRIGQTRNVEVIKLIAGESIEQRVVELQDIKKEVIRQVISDDDGSVTSASLEDIAFVLD